MFSVAKEWMDQLLYYFLLVYFGFQILPKKEYENYYRVIAGLLLLLLLLKPLQEWKGLHLKNTKEYEKDYLRKYQRNVEKKQSELEKMIDRILSEQ